ncbi:MAG: hypothetical protein LBI77_00005, partial [Puniceicoccales bacterium]|nr:hypothetical protein [Puniceicoccales bacterium]
MKKKIFSSLFSSYLLLGCLTNTVMFESTLRAVEKPISLELNEKGDLKNLYKEVLSALEKQSLAADTSRKNSLKKDPNERIRKAFEEISEKEESRLVICQTIEKNMKNLKKNEKVKLRELIRRLLVLQGENSKFGELMKEKLDLKLDLNLILDDISDIGKVKAEKTQKFVLLLNGKDENRENLARIIVDFIVLAAKACLINGKDFQFSSFEVNMGNKGEKFIKLLSDVIFPKKADEVPSIPDTSAPSTSAFSSSMIFEASDSSKASFSEILKKLSAKVDEDKDIEDLKATFDKIFDQIKEKGETLDSFIPLKFKSEESRKNIYEVLIEELIEKAKKDKIDADEVKKFEELLRSMKSFFKDSDSKEDCVSLNKIMEESMNQTSIIIWANQKQIIFNDKKSEAIEEVICNIVDFIIMEIYECVSNFPVPDDKFLDIFDSINLVKWLSKIGHLTEKPSTEKMELKALLPLEEKADVSKSSPLIFPEIDHLIKKSSTGIELKVLSPLDRKADVSKSS